MCLGQTSPSGNGGGSPEKRWGNGGTVESHYARNSVKADPHYIPKGNNFSTKYEAGKSLPTGDKNSASYWMNLTSTDGGKTLHNDKATALALEHGYNNAAYQIDHKNERQKAGIKDLDPAGFNTNFYKGNTFEMPSSKGHPAEGLAKTKTIPSDKQTINALPKLIMNTNLMNALFGAKPAKGANKAKTEPVKSNTAKKRNRQLDSGTQIKGSLLTSNNKYSGGTSFGRKNKLGA